MQLLYEIFLSWSCTWARLQKHGILRQTSSIPDPPAGAAPSSPVRSSAGTALPDTSTCSPSADFGSPTEVCLLAIGLFFRTVFKLKKFNLPVTIWGGWRLSIHPLYHTTGLNLSLKQNWFIIYCSPSFNVSQHIAPSKPLVELLHHCQSVFFHILPLMVCCITLPREQKTTPQPDPFFFS